jgi:hypothetical protein
MFIEAFLAAYLKYCKFYAPLWSSRMNMEDYDIRLDRLNKTIPFLLPFI